MHLVILAQITKSEAILAKESELIVKKFFVNNFETKRLFSDE